MYGVDSRHFLRCEFRTQDTRGHLQGHIADRSRGGSGSTSFLVNVAAPNQDPVINAHIGDARSYASHHPGEYDLVEIGLIDSIGLSDSGGYSIHENYTYTSEAIREYMNGLSDEGILSITVWNRLSPPRNVLKLLSTVVHALRADGVEDISDRVFVFDLFLSTATILVKNSAFTEGEVYDLRKFCETRSFEVAYYPGIDRRGVSLDEILTTFTNHFELNKSVEEWE